ncbi:MAG: hypothetical protein JO327_07460 [Nitrososphaeraceae archaeon]|nr:hypothetical protein [Nitrososphaeraceae archaeon]MBV9667953.1 hypothetical protein [Nitrososphaeraceae archaeon]
MQKQIPSGFRITLYIHYNSSSAIRSILVANDAVVLGTGSSAVIPPEIQASLDVRKVLQIIFLIALINDEIQPTGAQTGYLLYWYLYIVKG